MPEKGIHLKLKILVFAVWLLSLFLSAQVFVPAQSKPKKQPSGGTSNATTKILPTAPTISGQNECQTVFQPNTKRVALVIGNRDYDFSPLMNPVNDARLVANSLKQVGFDVLLYENLTNEQFATAIQEFNKRLVSGGVALFYYAGHGVQFSDRNYLVPVDFENVEELSGENVEKKLFYVGRVLEIMTAKKCLNILILDACRNAPVDLKFPEGTEAGFAEIKSATFGGTYIAFSTSPGDVASDGRGLSNSPYSYWLADSLKLRPSRLEDVFMRTRIQVERLTNSGQIPWENSSLKQKFYFTSDDFFTSSGNQNLTAGSLRNQIPLSLFQTTKFNVELMNENGTVAERKIGTSKFYTEKLPTLGVELKKLEMAQIAGGKFAMGASGFDALIGFNESKKDDSDTGADWAVNEMPQHCVGIPDFYISRYEITQAQWFAVMGSLPNKIPAEFRGWNLPVVNVSWDDAVIFCEKLTKLTGRTYRLPTEAEWEYAARAKIKSPFGFGKTLTPTISNYFWLVGFGSGPSGREPLRKTWNVGESNIANGFGLFDMHGNVAEWCEDVYFGNYSGAPKDGIARKADATSENSHVIRGGSWEDIPSNCRITSRWNAAFDYRSTTIGFRVAAR